VTEVYFSIDIEADGPIPGVNNMLSLGAAAFAEDGEMLSTFSVNLETLEGATSDPDTMEWWTRQPAAWLACRKDLERPEDGIRCFVSWVQQVCVIRPGTPKPVFVGYPAGFDFTFVYWYLIKFMGPGKSPFSFAALDIKSFAMAVMGCRFRDVGKRMMKAFMPKDLPHTHVAVDDAIEQGHLFMNLLRHSKASRG
jgi:hypothetical protein